MNFVQPTILSNVVLSDKVAIKLKGNTVQLPAETITQGQYCTVTCRDDSSVVLCDHQAVRTSEITIDELAVVVDVMVGREYSCLHSKFGHFST